METATLIDQHFDERYLVDTLVRLLRVPTDVPLGHEVFMAPDDPKLVHFVQDVLRPAFVDVGAYDAIDPGLNQVVLRLGTGETDRALLLMAYTPAQHHNLMDDPFGGKIQQATAYGYDEPCAFGQGASQNKAHCAALLSLAKTLIDAGVVLRGTLYLAINNEGRSSHACSDAIIHALLPKPTFGVILIGTGQRISLGNRGRVDVNITVRGVATHSSDPEAGLSAIDGANEVVSRLRSLTFTKQHPLLGGQHAVPYQIAYEPLAPHTLPATARIRVDRRLLPGDGIDAAVDEVRAALGDLAPFAVTVERGYHMLPALVDAAEPGVQALQVAHTAILGEPAATYHGRGAFDAGGPCAHGIPTVMYGASGGVGLLGPDFVPLRAVAEEVKVLLHLVQQHLA